MIDTRRSETVIWVCRDDGKWSLGWIDWSSTMATFDLMQEYYRVTQRVTCVVDMDDAGLEEHLALERGDMKNPTGKPSR